MSANVGFPPHRITVEADAKNVSGGTTTSCPLPIPWARSAMWRAAVPFDTAIPWPRPTYSANRFSNSATFAPWANCPLSRTSITARRSSSPRFGFAIGIIGPADAGFRIKPCCAVNQKEGWAAGRGPSAGRR